MNAFYWNNERTKKKYLNATNCISHDKLPQNNVFFFYFRKSATKWHKYRFHECDAIVYGLVLNEPFSEWIIASVFGMKRKSEYCVS
jgi:hypothetical protein